MKKALLITSVLAAAIVPVHAQLRITEVAPWSSSSSPLTADWFELTNVGALALDITGWKVDDNSNSSAFAVLFRGVTTINPGQSIVFFEGNSTGTTDTTIASSFNSIWGTSFVFGTSIGAYGGSNIGLSSGGDALNIYDGGNVLRASVVFGASPAAPALPTFDNAALLDGATISTASVAGVNGAYSFVDTLANTETGSPGVVPEPSTCVALISGVAMLVGLRRRRA